MRRHGEGGRNIQRTNRKGKVVPNANEKYNAEVLSKESNEV